MTITDTNPQSAADISEATLEMLRKLYARSQSSHSHLDTESARQAVEQEAAQATEMLGRLLDKYGLALADVDSKGHTHQIGHGHVGERTLDFGKSNFAWKIDLARAVVRHNNCKILNEIYHRNKIQGFVLVGLALHVEATMMMLEWLFAQIKALASADYKQYKSAHPYSWDHIDPLRWHTNFGKGAASRLDTRLAMVRSEQYQAEANATNGTAALALNIDTAIRDYLEVKEPWRRKSRLDSEAYMARRDTERRLAVIQAKAWPIWLSWQLPMVQFATLAGYQRLESQALAKEEEYRQERTKTDAEQDKKYAKSEKARQRRREKFYQEHGYYPEDVQREKKDTTEWTAYDAGYTRAEAINLSPHLAEGEREAPAAIGG